MSEKKTPMPCQDVSERIKNFDEVDFGYDAEQALSQRQATFPPSAAESVRRKISAKKIAQGELKASPWQ